MGLNPLSNINVNISKRAAATTHFKVAPATSHFKKGRGHGHTRQNHSESWCKVINCHNLSSYYIAWILNLEMILSMCWNQYEVLTYGWNLKVVIYPYGLDHYWWRLVATCILNRGTIISYGIETMCPLRWSKRHHHKIYGHSNFFRIEKRCDTLEPFRKHPQNNKLDEATKKLDEIISAMCFMDEKKPKLRNAWSLCIHWLKKMTH